MRRLVVLGASDAVGVGCLVPKEEGWAHRLAADLGMELHNLGVWGADASEARRTMLPRALTLEVELAAIWLGLNEILFGVPEGDYLEALEEVVARLTAGGVRVLLGNLPDVSSLPAFGELAAGVRPRNEGLARIARAHGATLVDVHGEVDLGGHPEYVSEDEFHPSPLGHAKLAALFLTAAGT